MNYVLKRVKSDCIRVMGARPSLLLCVHVSKRSLNVLYKLPVLEHQEVRIPVHNFNHLELITILKVYIKGHIYKIHVHVHYIQSLL